MTYCASVLSMHRGGYRCSLLRWGPHSVCSPPAFGDLVLLKLAHGHAWVLMSPNLNLVLLPPSLLIHQGPMPPCLHSLPQPPSTADPAVGLPSSTSKTYAKCIHFQAPPWTRLCHLLQRQPQRPLLAPTVLASLGSHRGTSSSHKCNRIPPCSKCYHSSLEPLE